MNSLSTRTSLFGAALVSLLLTSGAPAHAQGGGKGNPLKRAEAINGKPLTDAQKKAIQAAADKRQQKIKPIQAEFKAAVAKALGLTPAQFKQREDKLRADKEKGD